MIYFAQEFSKFLLRLYKEKSELFFEKEKFYNSLMVSDLSLINIFENFVIVLIVCIVI